MKNKLYFNLILLCLVTKLCSCTKEVDDNTATPNVPVVTTSYILDSIVTEDKPTCTGCKYLVKGIKKFFYDNNGKVYKTISTSYYSNNSVLYDTTILELINGNAFQTTFASIIGSPEKPYQGKKDLGPVSSFNSTLVPINVTKTYKYNLPSDAGSIDSLEYGTSDIAYDSYGRLSKYSYQYYQTILTKNSFPLERKVIAFPYQITNQNDKDGLIRSEYVSKIIDDDQRKNSVSEGWYFLKNFFYTSNGVNYYSPYYLKEETTILRSNYKLLNPPYLFYTEIPENYLPQKRTTNSYISSDSTKGWTLTKTDFNQYMEITMDNDFLQSYILADSNSKIISSVKYYFRVTKK